MFNSPVIDLAILLSFTYFIGSLIVSTVNEALVNGALELRKKNLKQALEGLLTENEEWTKYVKEKLAANPHITTLMKKKGEYPSFIPASNFISALVTELRKDGDYTKDNLTAKITASDLPQEMKDILQDFANQADKDIKAFEAKIETFYNNAMDRGTGWYKKSLRNWLFVLGFIAAVALNIDTIRICKDAFDDKDKLSQAVDRIAALVPNINAATDSSKVIYTIKIPADTAASKEKKAKKEKASPKDDTILTSITVQNEKAIDHALDTANKKDNSGTNPPTTAQSKKNIEQLTRIYQNTTGNPFGYASCDDFWNQWTDGSGWDRLWTFLIKLIGIVITAFALQLGADYWFGWMLKMVNIRGAGKNTDEKK